MTVYSVFDPETLYMLARAHRPVFERLRDIEAGLNLRFADLHDPILALMLAVAAGEPLLLKGPPGTAKSWLVRSFCRYIGIDPDTSGTTESNDAVDTEYFEYLLTPFTEPGELFGYFDVAKAQSREGAALVREERGMMQNARVVYLDEVFKGSSAILNTLLSFMNERRFHDRGRRKPVRMECLFGATNEVPSTSELRAIYDRFLLRCDIHNVDESPPTDVSGTAGSQNTTGLPGGLANNLGNLINKGWQETYSKPPVEEDLALLDGLKAFREHANKALTGFAPLPDKQESRAFLLDLARNVSIIRQHDLSQMSNRRVVKLMYIMMIHAIYRTVKSWEPKKEVRETGEILLSDEEMQLLRFMLDRRDELAEQHLRFPERR